jgi:hypothetical protein
MKISVPVAKACDIANINRKRFTEAVATGYYATAPESEHGKSRLFDENEMISLVNYGMRLNEGWPPRLASHFSDLLYQVLDQGGEEEDAVSILVGVPGNRESHPGSKLNGFAAKTTQSTMPTHYQEIINVAWIRKYVRKCVADEPTDQGDADEREAGYARSAS